MRALCLSAAFLLAAVSASADDKDAPLPEGVEDAAFARFVDLALVRKAVVTRDAALLCDVALQLAEGERVLLRPHAGLPSGRLFRLALQAATEKRDLKTLDRVGEAAKARKMDDLAKLLPAARMLAGKARRLDTGLMVSADSMSVEALLAYRAYLEQLNVAVSLNDRTRLEGMEASLSRLEGLSDSQRASIKQRIGDAKASLGDKSDKADEGDELLRKLAGSSRRRKAKAD